MCKTYFDHNQSLFSRSVVTTRYPYEENSYIHFHVMEKKKYDDVVYELQRVTAT